MFATPLGLCKGREEVGGGILGQGRESVSRRAGSRKWGSGVGGSLTSWSSDCSRLLILRPVTSRDGAAEVLLQGMGPTSHSLQ